MVEQFVFHTHYSGVILIGNTEKIFYEKSYGYADKKLTLLHTSKTKFPIASITKTLTAALLLKILDEREIALDALVQDYLGAQFPSELTIHSLLTHQSGLALYTDFNRREEKRSLPLSRDNFYKLMLDNSVKLSEFNYNNGNYILLEHLIEKITQCSYIECLQDKILKPSGMEQTHIVSVTQQEGLAIGYDKNGDKALSIDYTWLGGGAGLYSTVYDLYIFARRLLNKQILSKAMLQSSFQDYGGSYGYGWTLGKIGLTPVCFHEGGIDGFSTMLMVDPVSTTIIVMLSNSEIDIASLCEQIFLFSIKNRF